MSATQQWTVERYKSFEFWLSDPHRVGQQPFKRKWRCELRIISLNAEAREHDIVVKTIYPFSAGDTPEGIYASAFVESLRICDQILDRPKTV
ncbi:MAG TPA: hypothetical protein VGN04_03570 [Herbaspirillum sp.]